MNWLKSQFGDKIQGRMLKSLFEQENDLKALAFCKCFFVKKSGAQKGVFLREWGIRILRRYPRPAPEKQAFRSSGGICESNPPCFACGDGFESTIAPPKERKKDAEMASFFLWRREWDSNP